MDLEPSLERWVAANLVSEQQAASIREWEAARSPQSKGRLPIILGLTFGGLMLATGILLFVSAHWDELSPFARMTMLIAMVTGLHGAAAYFSERLPAMARTLHAVGTVSLGAAIFLAGQIFNMEEHWPAGVLMWAIGAVAGWLLLRDWPQMALAALLVPFWLIGEWIEAARPAVAAWQVSEVAVLLLALCYLSLRHPRSPSDDTVRALGWIGGLALIPAVVTMALDGHYRYAERPTTEFELVGWAGAVILPLALSYWYRRADVWMNAVAAAWVVGLSWITQDTQGPLLYAWCALGAAGLIAWGIRELRPERINLGMAGFAITLICFYFSNVMDRLGRSFSLIVLGIVFLAGGWYGEKLRRGFIARINEGAAQ
ncbi:DUF2157 domain-containing protein [uncultured Paludibaculum sp.]|uniref:DUF2157 domain-containing protein n=1 Tax=uncultured Paludibaculum sp. TaxID=1765020 RepID=UPI002AABD2C7|nr:DUF2157 domain-containing protein [uncultured Paludibaculum sp.]